MTTTLSKADAAALDQALTRTLERNRGLDVAAATIALTACNATCPLDFAKLAAADDFTLAHDVYGIMNHLDPATGRIDRDRLTEGLAFWPLCAR